MWTPWVGTCFFSWHADTLTLSWHRNDTEICYTVGLCNVPHPNNFPCDLVETICPPKKHRNETSGTLYQNHPAPGCFNKKKKPWPSPTQQQQQRVRLLLFNSVQLWNCMVRFDILCVSSCGQLPAPPKKNTPCLTDMAPCIETSFPKKTFIFQPQFFWDAPPIPCVSSSQTSWVYLDLSPVHLIGTTPWGILWLKRGRLWWASLKTKMQHYVIQCCMFSSETIKE